MKELRLNKIAGLKEDDLKKLKGGIVEVKCGCGCGEVNNVSNVDSSNVSNKKPTK